MALGKGLASLIGGRSEEDAQSAIEKIDSMELIEGEDFDRAPVTKSINLTEEADLHEMDEMDDDQPVLVPPSIAPTTPLTIPDGLLDEPINVERESKTMLTVEQIPDDAFDEPAKIVAQDEKIEEEAAASPIVEAEKKNEEILVIKTEPVKVRPKENEKSKTAKVTAVKPLSTKTVKDDDSDAWDKHEEKVIHVPVGDIQLNPNQPRRQFDPHELQELVDSIEQHGILQPLVVKRVAKNAYELIAGERRLRAAQQLEWERVPCVVRVEVQGTESSLVYALIENLQREDLNPVEVAHAYEQLNKEFGMTHEEIGVAMGTSRVRITNVMRVLQLPAEIQRGLSEGKITSGHAKAILMIPDPEKQIRFYHHLVDEGLTVRKAEVRARRIQRAMKVDDPMRHKGRRGRHELSVKFRPFLEDRYGFNADVKFLDAKNRFEVIFRAYNDAEVKQLIDRLLGHADLPQGVDDDVIGDDELEEDEE